MCLLDGSLGILDDTYALCEVSDLPLSSLLTFINVYRKELNYVVLSKLIDVRLMYLCSFFYCEFVV